MITQKQRDAYRYALEDAGVPEVFAYMASLNNDSALEEFDGPYSAEFLISGGFIWGGTPEGRDFWQAVSQEMLASSLTR